MLPSAPESELKRSTIRQSVTDPARIPLRKAQLMPLPPSALATHLSNVMISASAICRLSWISQQAPLSYNSHKTDLKKMNYPVSLFTTCPSQLILVKHKLAWCLRQSWICSKWQQASWKTRRMVHRRASLFLTNLASELRPLRISLVGAQSLPLALPSRNQRPRRWRAGCFTRPKMDRQWAQPQLRL